MRTPSEFLEQIGTIVGVELVEGRIDIDFRWDNFTEAKLLLDRLSTMLTDLRLVRQELAVIAREIRRVHRDKLDFVDKLASEDDHLFGSERQTSLEVDANMRRRIRVTQQEALAPYGAVRAAVDAVDLRLRAIQAEVRSSPEYLTRPTKPRPAPAHHGRRYFVKVAEEVKGPLSAEQVSGLILAGVVSRESMIQVDGIDSWIPIQSVREIE